MISKEDNFIQNRKRKLFRTSSQAGDEVPVSVLLADTLDRPPKYTNSKDPKERSWRFWEALERRDAAIREDMRQYIP